MNTNIITRLRVLTVLVLGLLWCAPQAFAQTYLTQTTLSAAIVNPSDQTMTLTSSTGFTATTASAQTYALIDREVVAIRTVGPTAGVIGITRGQFATRATGHASGAPVFYIPAGSVALTNYDRSGTCSSATTTTDPNQNASYLPVINPNDGFLFTCIGTVTSGVLNGSWARIDLVTPGVAPLQASTGATQTLSVGQCGMAFAVDRAAGVVYTLPPPIRGCTFDFIWTVAQTSSATKIVTAAVTSTTLFLQGTPLVIGTTTMGFAGVPTTSVAVETNDTTTGGLIGGHLRFTAISATIWDVQGTLMGSGTVATPFTTSN